ncbi:MAG: hypothetical protein AAGU11_08495 [Syntrophobacteraceae bacterium]
MHSKIGQLDESIRTHNKALDLAKRKEDLVGILVDMAMVYLLKKDFKSAEKTFKMSIAKAGDEVPTTKIHYEMGKMYVEWPKLSKARESFKSALDQLKYDTILKNTAGYETDIIWYLGFIAYGLGDSDETKKHMLTVLERVDESNKLYAESNLILGHQYYKMDHMHKAGEHYYKVITARKADPESISVAKKFLASILMQS